MAKAPDPRIGQAKAMYLEGMKLVEIAGRLGLPEGTVRRWKCTHKWDGERSDGGSERSDKKDARKEAAAGTTGPAAQNHGLNERQQLFCLYYSMGDSVVGAYQKAYRCGYNTAAVEGHRSLKKPKIRAEVERLKRERFEAQLFGEHDIFQWYLDVAMASITDYVSFGREEVPVMGASGPVTDKETGEQLLKEVNYVKFKESSEVNGHVIKKVRLGKDGASIELHDSMQAMNWLAGHMHMGTGVQQGLANTIMAAYQKRMEEGEGHAT